MDYNVRAVQEDVLEKISMELKKPEAQNKLEQILGVLTQYTEEQSLLTADEDVMIKYIVDTFVDDVCHLALVKIEFDNFDKFVDKFDPAEDKPDFIKNVEEAKSYMKAMLRSMGVGMILPATSYVYCQDKKRSLTDVDEDMKRFLSEDNIAKIITDARIYTGQFKQDYGSQQTNTFTSNPIKSAYQQVVSVFSGGSDKGTPPVDLGGEEPQNRTVTPDPVRPVAATQAPLFRQNAPPRQVAPRQDAPRQVAPRQVAPPTAPLVAPRQDAPGVLPPTRFETGINLLAEHFGNAWNQLPNPTNITPEQRMQAFKLLMITVVVFGADAGFFQNILKKIYDSCPSSAFKEFLASLCVGEQGIALWIRGFRQFLDTKVNHGHISYGGDFLTCSYSPVLCSTTDTARMLPGAFISGLGLCALIMYAVPGGPIAVTLGKLTMSTIFYVVAGSAAVRTAAVLNTIPSFKEALATLQGGAGITDSVVWLFFNEQWEDVHQDNPTFDHVRQYGRAYDKVFILLSQFVWGLINAAAVGVIYKQCVLKPLVEQRQYERDLTEELKKLTSGEPEQLRAAALLEAELDFKKKKEEIEASHKMDYTIITAWGIATFLASCLSPVLALLVYFASMGKTDDVAKNKILNALKEEGIRKLAADIRSKSQSPPAAPLQLQPASSTTNAASLPLATPAVSLPLQPGLSAANAAPPTQRTAALPLQPASSAAKALPLQPAPSSSGLLTPDFVNSLARDKQINLTIDRIDRAVRASVNGKAIFAALNITPGQHNDILALINMDERRRIEHVTAAFTKNNIQHEIEPFLRLFTMMGGKYKKHTYTKVRKFKRRSSVRRRRKTKRK